MLNYVEFKNVSKTFDHKTIIQLFNLSINKGEFVSFLGPSGCGKTTLLRILAGLEQNSQGEIYIDEKF